MPMKIESEPGFLRRRSAWGRTALGVRLQGMANVGDENQINFSNFSVDNTRAPAIVSFASPQRLFSLAVAKAFVTALPRIQCPRVVSGISPSSVTQRAELRAAQANRPRRADSQF